MAKDAEYEYRGEEPLNREPKIRDLLSSYITIKEPYDRNHGPIPQIDPSQHVVRIEGLVDSPLDLNMRQLEHDFEQHEVLCALQCAGNRRHTMRTVIKEVQGIDWFNGAVMNCLWKGPRLRDVLQQAGIQASLFDENAASAPKGHVEFACYEQQVQEDSWYGGSISLKRAIDADADVILALGMNGERLNAEHGAPVRVVVPGVAGARSVKWLSKITVQEEDSKNFYQQHDYKILPPEATDREVAEKYWSKVDPMMDMPVNSIIGMPDSGETIRISSDGRVEVRGYAVPHGRDGPVRKVEVSGDGGKTWIEADLEFGGYGDLSTEANAKKVRWAWCLWSAKVEVSQGPHRRIVSRATDSKGNTQQEQSEWNLRGVGYNGWGSADELAIV